MINLLFTISTAEGGFVVLLEDLVIHKQYQGPGLWLTTTQTRDRFREAEEFSADHFVDRSAGKRRPGIFPAHGFVESSMIPMRLWVAPQNE